MDTTIPLHKSFSRLAGVLLAIAFLAGPVMALTPEEVLVVGNASVPASAELAAYYAEQRGVPAENIVLIETTGDYDISRTDYEETIRQPVMAALREHDQNPPIKCIVLMWGVPVRVSQTAIDSNPVAARYVQAAREAQLNLAVARILLTSVGQSFPALPDLNSLQLEDLFDEIPAPPVDPLPLVSLEHDLAMKFESKGTLAISLENTNQRLMAIRQVMALQLEVNGLRGLINYVEDVYRNPDAAQAARIAEYRRVLEQATARLAALPEEDDTVDALNEKLELMQFIGGQLLVANYTDHAAERFSGTPNPSADAAVDSELAALWLDTRDYSDRVDNPLYFRAEGVSIISTPVVMCCRIDGVTADDARRIIDDSIATEAQGLQGKFYVDAGIPSIFANRDANGGYVNFSLMLEALGRIVRENTDLNVVIDTEPSLFGINACPDAGLYIGWYSLRNYVDAFDWNRGAVAYHVASFEAMNLRDPASDEWCPQLIHDGVAATIGAVREPYLGQFPEHQAFFLLLLTGEYTIAECYWRTIPSASWRMTLIADPLYNPFRENPQLDTNLLGPMLPDEDWPPLPLQHLGVDGDPLLPDLPAVETD
jgi:uncharacterized protein (TIGR03790 family)